MPEIIYIVSSHLNSLSAIWHAPSYWDRLGVGQGQVQTICMVIGKLIIMATRWFKALHGPFKQYLRRSFWT